MDAIVAIYDNWGIGRDGTQTLVLSADRRHFRELTMGATVIVGRRTLADFPGGKPLQGRRNLVLTRQDIAIEGAQVVHTAQEAAAAAGENAFVIGGESVYRALLPLCERVLVTRIYADCGCDRFFPDLDADGAWRAQAQSQRLEENGNAYQFITYTRQK